MVYSCCWLHLKFFSTGGRFPVHIKVDVSTHSHASGWYCLANPTTSAISKPYYGVQKLLEGVYWVQSHVPKTRFLIFLDHSFNLTSLGGDFDTSLCLRFGGLHHWLLSLGTPAPAKIEWNRSFSVGPVVVRPFQVDLSSHIWVEKPKDHMVAWIISHVNIFAFHSDLAELQSVAVPPLCAAPTSMSPTPTWITVTLS